MKQLGSFVSNQNQEKFPACIITFFPQEEQVDKIPATD